MTDDAALPSTQRGNTGSILLMSLAHIFNDSYPNLYPVLIPPLMLALHFNLAQAGFITSVAALTTQLLQPFLGLAADHTGGRWFVPGGLALGAVLSTAALALSPTYHLLLLAMLLGGLGNAAFHPQAASIVGEMTRERKGLGMSMFLIGGNLGRGLAPLAAWFIFSLWGRQALLLWALPGLVLALVLHRHGRRVEKAVYGAGHLLASLRANRGRLASLLVIVGTRSLVVLSLVTFLPVYWHIRYGATNNTAFLLSILLLTGSAGNFLGGYFSDLVGRAPILILSALLSTVWLWLFIHAGGGFAVWVLIALLGVTLYSMDSVTMVLGQGLFPENKGMASGVVIGVGNTLGAGGVALVGLYAQHRGVPAALALLIPVLLLSLPFVYSFRESRG